LIFIGIFGLLAIIKQKTNEQAKIKVISKKNLTDQHFLNYFSLFVLLALTFDLSKICFICVLVVIMVFIGVVYIRNNIFYINPLLNIMGYSFYDITYEDEDGERQEIRIFHKGKIELGEQKYCLSFSKRNLNFLEKIDN
jgi:fatty-acid desaturase